MTLRTEHASHTRRLSITVLPKTDYERKMGRNHNCRCSVNISRCVRAKRYHTTAGGAGHGVSNDRESPLTNFSACCARDLCMHNLTIQQEEATGKPRQSQNTLLARIWNLGMGKKHTIPDRFLRSSISQFAEFVRCFQIYQSRNSLLIYTDHHLTSSSLQQTRSVNNQKTRRWVSHTAHHLDCY